MMETLWPLAPVEIVVLPQVLMEMKQTPTLVPQVLLLYSLEQALLGLSKLISKQVTREKWTVLVIKLA